MPFSPNPRDYIYDLESYPNVFTCASKHVVTGKQWVFEISYRRNDIDKMMEFLGSLHRTNSRMIGFNNLGYDYPLLHSIINRYPGTITPFEIYQKTCELIFASKDEKFGLMVWPDDRYIEQIDLYKIHHFDNVSRATSLKMLEFNMRRDKVRELPFPPGTFLEPDQIDTLIDYNLNDDVESTEQFYLESLEAIDLREKLTAEFNHDFMNHNDTKIGKDYLIMKLEEAAPGTCYTRENGRREPRQTHRPFINLSDVIFPYIQFFTPEFERIKQWLATQRITETKGVFKDLSCTVNGFKFDFGTGGLHGSVESCIVSADEQFAIVDVDVTSFYPKIGIVNKAHPAHLGELFCRIYEEVFIRRKEYAKGTPLNQTFKLALNGTYGDSNSVYSPFYDPQYTMTITINGQLLLCMLAEYLMTIKGLTLIQANTDGLTIKVPHDQKHMVTSICAVWESITGLELESVEYSRMFIRDVNNYIAEKLDGKLKRKGAYCHETNIDNPGTSEIPWHKDHGGLVIQKAAEAALVRGESIREFIVNHDDIYDFMLRTKVPKASKLVWHTEAWGDLPLQNITRYYISTDGFPIVKIMPPAWKDFYVYGGNGDHETAKLWLQKQDVYYFIDNRQYFVPTKAAADRLEKLGFTFVSRARREGPTRRIGIDTGWKVTPCNDIHHATRDNLNYEYYIAEAEKLVRPLHD